MPGAALADLLAGCSGLMLDIDSLRDPAFYRLLIDDSRKRTNLRVYKLPSLLDTEPSDVVM